MGARANEFFKFEVLPADRSLVHGFVEDGLVLFFNEDNVVFSFVVSDAEEDIVVGHLVEPHGVVNVLDFLGESPAFPLVQRIYNKRGGVKHSNLKVLREA